MERRSAVIKRASRMPISLVRWETVKAIKPKIVGSDGEVTYARAHDVSTRSLAPREPGAVFVDVNVAPSR